MILRFIMLLLFSPFFSLGQLYIPKGWKTKTDTINLPTKAPKIKKWLIYKTNISNYDLEVLVPQKIFISLAKKHFNFLKRTGANPYFKSKSPENALKILKTIIKKVQSSDTTTIDSSFIASIKYSDDLMLIIESIMYKGDIMLMHKKDYLNKYLIAKVYPTQIPRSIPVKYIPKHLHGNGGNSYFSLPESKYYFYSIKNVDLSQYTTQ